LSTITASSALESVGTLNVVTAGYSGTPLAVKIGIKEGHRVRLIGAPREWSIDDLPANVKVFRRRTSSPVDVAIAFFEDAASLIQAMGTLADIITLDGSLWIAWPRRAAGHRSDITDHVVRSAVLQLGLADVKVAALDENWSALKTVWRRELRAKQR
jgi:hypothetical protein